MKSLGTEGLWLALFGCHKKIVTKVLLPKDVSKNT